MENQSVPFTARGGEPGYPRSVPSGKEQCVPSGSPSDSGRLDRDALYDERDLLGRIGSSSAGEVFLCTKDQFEVDSQGAALVVHSSGQ